MRALRPGVGTAGSVDAGRRCPGPAEASTALVGSLCGYSCGGYLRLAGDVRQARSDCGRSAVAGHPERGHAGAIGGLRPAAVAADALLLVLPGIRYLPTTGTSTLPPPDRGSHQIGRAHV